MPKLPKIGPKPQNFEASKLPDKMQSLISVGDDLAKRLKVARRASRLIGQEMIAVEFKIYRRCTEDPEAYAALVADLKAAKVPMPKNSDMSIWIVKRFEPKISVAMASNRAMALRGALENGFTAEQLLDGFRCKRLTVKKLAEMADKPRSKAPEPEAEEEVAERQIILHLPEHGKAAASWLNLPVKARFKAILIKNGGQDVEIKKIII